MTQDTTYRSVGLAALVVLAAVIGSVAAAGTVAAQDAGENTSNESASEEDFYSPSDEEPLNVRFRDGAANTVESVAEGVLNLNIVYGAFDGPYDVEITAPGLSEEQIEESTFDDEGYDTEDLDRTAIVGMDFGDVPAGEYEFTVSVVGGDAERTVPLEVTGDEGAESEMGNETNATTDTADNETTANETETTNVTATNETTDTETTEQTTNATAANETATNETEMGNGTAETATPNATAANGTAGNASITATPAAAGASANYTVTIPVDEGSAGNLSAVSVDYTGSNATVSLGPSMVTAANVSGENVSGNVTSAGLGAAGESALISFDGTRTVEAGDTVTLTFGGITNPTEAGEYEVGMDVNPENGSGATNATLSITEATETTGTAATATTGGETAAGSETTAGGETAAGTDGGAGTNASEQGTEAGGPGFGIAVAVVALLGAALLATRRS